MAFSNRMTFGFSHQAVLNHVEAIGEPAHRGAVIVQLEEIRRSVLANGKSGTLIMIDPDNGNEVQPEEEAYGDVLVTALRDYLDPELYKLKTIPYVAGKQSGREPEHDPHYTDQIRWNASRKALIALLEGLLSRGLIEATLDQLPAIAVCHFSDKFEEPFSVDELSPYFSKRPKVEAPEECPPIVWKGDQPPLAHLIVSLAARNMIAHKTSAYLDITTTHFVKAGGAEYNRGTLRSSKGRIKKMKESSTSLEPVERILVELLKIERDGSSA